MRANAPKHCVTAMAHPERYADLFGTDFFGSAEKPGPYELEKLSHFAIAAVAALADCSPTDVFWFRLSD